MNMSRIQREERNHWGLVLSFFYLPTWKLFLVACCTISKCISFNNERTPILPFLESQGTHKPAQEVEITQEITYVATYLHVVHNAGVAAIWSRD